MKRILHILLMISVLLPGLPCDLVLGAGKAHAALASVDSVYYRYTAVPKVRLMKDIVKVRVKKTAYNIVVSKPKLTKISFAQFVASPENYFGLSGLSLAICQLPDWPDPANLRPPVLATTQRLRE